LLCAESPNSVCRDASRMGGKLSAMDTLVQNKV
jgi:hypothetical protein